MLGTKIRNWMEAHIARSRAKRKETRAKPPTATATLVVGGGGGGGGGLGLGDDVRYFDAKYLAGRDPKLDEILPTLPTSPSSFKPYRGDEPRRRPHQRDGPTTAERQHLQRQQQQQQQQQHHHHQQYKGGDGGQVNAGAVNLSSPESAYSTGYSTDGTSPCATYAPEHYVSARTTTTAAAQRQQQQQQRRAPPVLPQPPPPLDAAVGGQRNRVRGRRPDAEWQRIEARAEDAGVRGLAGGTGTYSVSRSRYPADARGLGEEEEEEEEEQQQQQHPWRKPAPPTIGRPLTSSPRIHPGGEYGRRACPAVSATTSINYPLQLFSPRRMAPLPAPQPPLVATAGTQVVPIISPRQRSRVRTNPWNHQAARRQPLAAAMMPFGGLRPWSRQQQQQQQQQRRRQCYSINDYCCRQESLSVGRSPVNRSDWCFSGHQLRQQQQQQQHRQRFGSSTRSASSASSCSSRSRSCSLSSSSNNSNSIPSSPSSDDITLNEVMGKFDENYLYEKETDIVSDHGGGWASTDNVSSSVNFSSDASACSSFDGSCPSSRSASRQRPRGPASGRRQRRRRHRRSGFELDDEEERRGEVELLQEVMSRRFQRSSGGEASARANRALLERLLMKNNNASLGGRGGGGGDGGGPRRAWSANPAALRATGPASRSVGGTPICLRRANAAGGGGGGPNSPSCRIGFERRNHHQVYPAESTSSLQSISASELALLEADKEADLKYAQLIMEAEQMLISAQQQLRCEESSCNSRCGSPASGAIDGSPSRFSRKLQQQQQQQQQQTCKVSAPNKRVELIKNAELNIELALSKSRNSQSELSSGSIKDLLDHSSPKRLLQQQQKKVINPVLTQTAVSTHTTGNLTDFRSIDVNPAAMLKNACQADELNPSSEYYSCPQSEPVKRKVYEAHRQENGRLLQRHQAPPWLRNSDGDCANDQHQQQQHQQHQQSQLQSASAASSYSQLRKHMLIETLQGLKQSLEDQSAALKMSCLRPL